jgi:DNA replication protein DnaC
MNNLALAGQLKKLRLVGILDGYEVRLAEARENALGHDEWLSLILQDEIQRRENQALITRLKQASFEKEKTFETFNLLGYLGTVQQRIRDLMVGHYLKEQKHILIAGPTGTGKTHLAQALAHQACRQGKKVKFIRAAVLWREMHASRADKTWEKVLKKFVSPDLLVIDDFGLSTLSFEQAEDLYELIVERNQKGSFIFTSNRKIEKWLELFPDAAIGNAALDRVVSQSHVLILEGESYRCKLQKEEVNMIKKI